MTSAGSALTPEARQADVRIRSFKLRDTITAGPIMRTFYQHLKKSNSSLTLICLSDVIGTVELIRWRANVVGGKPAQESERRCARLALSDWMYRPPGD